MDNPNPKFKLILFGSGFIMALFIFLITWYINRNKPFLNTILWFIIILTIFGLIAGIIFLIVWLFKRHKIDLLFVMKNQILESCKINEPDEKTPVLLYNNHDSKYIGEFKGFSMIKTTEWLNYVDDKNTEEKTFFSKFLKEQNGTDKLYREEYIYILAFKPKNGGEQLLLALESDFNSLDSNPIILYGRGFSPKLYEFMFLSKHYDLGEMIELPVKNLVQKYALEHNMRELVNIIDNAIDVDASFRKTQEKSNIDDFRPGEPRK